jgi:hypothetical protein
MEVDEVIEKIGGFGPTQKKIVWLLNAASLFGSFHTLLYTFLTDDPGWRCGQQSKSACEMVDAGTCTPNYSSEFTSIVSEVKKAWCSR